MDKDAQRRIAVIERATIPPLDLSFAFGPMIPFVIGAALAWWFPEAGSRLALQATALWGCAILLFLSGVRRGASFRTEAGSTWAQIATMLALYALGCGARAAAWFDALVVCLSLLLVGYAVIFLLDPVAARRGEAPHYFTRLRRLQIPIALLALTLALLRAGSTPGG